MYGLIPSTQLTLLAINQSYSSPLSWPVVCMLIIYRIAISLLIQAVKETTLMAEEIKFQPVGLMDL